MLSDVNANANMNIHRLLLLLLAPKHTPKWRKLWRSRNQKTANTNALRSTETTGQEKQSKSGQRQLPATNKNFIIYLQTESNPINIMAIC